ncbi:MAG: hypothetical protein H3C62_10780 [Gemmatimonadaceae bacterium]|nr:hypothetical protein [Gemmatimonadaceae bacterium]
MSHTLPAAALLLRQPSGDGHPAAAPETALILDEVGGLLIARPLDATSPRVYDVTPETQFFFPPREHAVRILGPQKADHLIGGMPCLLGHDGYLEVCRQLPALQAALARAQGIAPGHDLPPAIARRLGLPVERADPLFPDFPGETGSSPRD